MRNKLKLAGLIIAAVFWTAACAPVPIPVVIADMDGFELPQYMPEDQGVSNWGTPSMRVNHEGLTIKHSYKTSDDVIHIVLTGKISNGIPQGLLWNNIPAGIPDNLGGGTVFGASNTGSYNGLGDYRIGTVSATSLLNMDAAGSIVVALGSPDFSSEWVQAAPYSAVVISGLVDRGGGAETITITETNDSLNLLSEYYRKPDQPANHPVFTTDSSGKLRKRTDYNYDPNQFDISSGTRKSRGGYGFLISEKANPRTAFFEIEYQQSGKKKRFEVDYSAVELRYDAGNLLTNVSFQNPTPAMATAGTYSLSGGTYDYAVTEDIVAGSIAVYPYSGGPAIKPLYIRPFYEPANIDPNKAATNMIKEIYLTDANGNRLNKSQMGNLVLKWDDAVQAITLIIDGYILESPYVSSGDKVIINAVLRSSFTDSSGNTIDRLTCTVTIIDDSTP
ncbi:MAG: hypothetical protein LBJ86_06025 [Spirochaetaceae bacterium]|jgi:hypothetical protein|nr:hypothetical protein [Spirochaetaceae bacterium]